METEPSKKNNVVRYVLFFVLAAAAIFGAMRIFAPRPQESDIDSQEASLFLKNKIIDIDEKLKKGEDETDLATRLSWHKSNTALYNEVKNSHDETIAAEREALKARMVKIQSREFPELRDAYVDSKKDALEQEQIKISLSGDHHDVLTFSGDKFEPKDAQKSFTKSIHEVVTDLRFKKIVYKWSDNQADSSDYKIDSKQDTEI